MPKGAPNSKPPSLAPWALVSQLGMVIAGPIVVAVLIGSYFDVGATLFIILILAGIVAGFAGAYRIIAPFLK